MIPRIPHSCLVAAGLLFATGFAQAAAMQDIGTASGPQCAGLDVNNAGHVVGVCAEADGSASAFVALAPGSAVDLQDLVSNRNCAAAAITNSGRVIGRCLDGDSLSTAVIWTVSPPAAPTSAQELASLLGGIRTQATAFNQGGVVAGVSINANGTALPAMWRNNETNARALPMGLLGLGATNCVPTDVDNAAVDPDRPDIVGNCPGSAGRPLPLRWSATGLLGAYVANALPLPTGAVYCATAEVVSGRVLGGCDFGAAGARTVVWSGSPAAPQVLEFVPPMRNGGADLNAHGQVVGHYRDNDGDSIPYFWDTQTNLRADIAALGGGFNADVEEIGDNGVAVGVSELGDGSRHAFSWTLAGGSLDLGTLPGGENSSAAGLSQDGCYLTGASEVAFEHATHAYVQDLCTP